jgi:hypothetical protein
VTGTEFAEDDVPAGGAAETAGTDRSTASAKMVTIAVADTSQSAGVNPPLATSTVVKKPRALRLKKAAMKKSSLSVQFLCLNAYSVLVDLFNDTTDFASLGLRLPWGLSQSLSRLL